MGIIIAVMVLLSWLIHFGWLLLAAPYEWNAPLLYLHIGLQAYLSTGLFITAHDSMHGTISKERRVNITIGTLCSFLFAGLSYNRLLKNHSLHHQFPGTAKDPDFSPTGNPVRWWLLFMYKYTTMSQLLIMAVAFNLLKFWIAEERLWLFWILPICLASIQLFYFGTYLPHRLPHSAEMEPHNARSQMRNHLWAMLSCYFFGYHQEHHISPSTPWWKLYSFKNIRMSREKD